MTPTTLNMTISKIGLNVFNVSKFTCKVLFFIALSYVHLGISQCTETSITNLVKNGTFTEGNTSITSGYTYCNTANCLYPEGLYSIGTNATFFHSAFSGIDHTTGKGNFMIINGAGALNTIIWSQIITVKPGVNYDFSAWVSSLNAGSPAKLQFQINGVTIGNVFNAPASSDDWQNFGQTWNSGTSSTATITILNQNNDLGGNDFGIDDISFVEVCPTQQPLLGNDISLCGLATIDLLSNITTTPTTVITWSTGATGTGTLAPTSINITNVGIYWVCVQDGSCIKSDSMVVTAGFNVNLGPDLILCKQASFLLDADHENDFTSYKWYKNNVLIQDSSRRSLLVTSPGTYKVEVTDASCHLTVSDEVIITSQAAIPNDVIFCPPAIPAFAVTPNPAGGFKWFDKALAGNLIGKGTSIDHSTEITKTLYAEDTTAFYYTVGAKSKFPSGFPSADHAKYFIFDAYESFTLKSVTIFANIWDPNVKIKAGVTLRNSAGGLITQKIVDLVGPPIVPVDNVWPFTINVDIAIPKGTGLQLSSEGSGTNQFFYAQKDGNTVNTVNWSAYQIPNIIKINSMDALSQFPDCRCYGFFYNWEIEKGSICARTPVTATLQCPLPLQWLYFEAHKSVDGSDIVLEWKTTPSNDPHKFVVERSTDGLNFKTIYIMSAHEMAERYSYTDASVENRPYHYYRIKEIDLAGKVLSNSQVISIKGPVASYSLHPNPSSHELLLKANESHIRKVEIYSKQGRLLKNISVEPCTELSLIISDLKPDHYIIKIYTEHDVFVQLFVKSAE